MKKSLLGLLLLAGACSEAPVEPIFTPAASPEIRFVGRAEISDESALSFDWSGCYLTASFHGTRCALQAGDTGRNYYNLFVDGEQTGVIDIAGADTTIVLAEGLRKGDHTIRLQKRTEGEQGRTTLRGLLTDGPLLPPPAAPGRHIEFIGDSHTCGYGTEGKSVKEPFTPQTENCELAWGCIIARYFDADYTLIAHSGQGMVRNWGDDLDCSICTMRERLLRTYDMAEEPRWNFETYKPDIVVIKLGSNDCSLDRIPTEKNYNTAYGVAIDHLREVYGEVPILCVAPSDNTTLLRHIENFVAERGDSHLFWAAMLPGITNWDSDMGANYHPNLHGQRKMAMSIIPFISTITGWTMPEKPIE